MGRTIARRLGYGREVPPKNLLKVYGLIFVIALVAVVIVTMIVMASGAHAGNHAEDKVDTVDRDSLVRIQVRAPTRVVVLMNGRPKGQTPLMLLVPRSDSPVEIAVTLGGRSVTKQVTPRQDSVLDFP
ncbi:hypothetical protein BH11MYX1_BH11MYX1_18070 [soil metagenome]